jgi:hypothetical protein
MKLRMLLFTAVSFGLTDAALAINYANLATKGYRWVTVNGPYACTTEQEVQQITSHRTDATETQMSRNLQAYYLIPGAIVQLLKDDPVTKMSEIQLAGITQPLWTYTRFLSAHPMVDIYGEIETPKNSGLIPIADTGVIRTEPAGSGPMPTPAAAQITPTQP